MIDLSLKAEVYCSDGVVGISTYLIGNPINHQITHLVVQSEIPPHYEYLVPFELVGDITSNLITLKCTQEEFQQMMLFKNEVFIPTEIPRHLSWPYCVPIPGAVPEEADYISVEHVNIPQGEQVVQRGALVEATDGTIGEVEELLINARGMQITHLVLLDQQFLKKTEITIPVSLIDSVDEDTIYLTVDRQTLEALPTTPIQRGRK